jgi:molybdate transport system substrate-binding protein
VRVFAGVAPFIGRRSRLPKGFVSLEALTVDRMSRCSTIRVMQTREPRSLLAETFATPGFFLAWKSRFALMILTAWMVSATHAAEVRVMAANAVKEAYVEAVSAFEKASGHKVTTFWGGTEGVARRVASGEVVDLVLIASPNIDKLIEDGTLVQGSRRDFARSGVGIAVRGGLPRPDISTPEAVKQAVLAARSIAYSSGPSGFHVAGLLRALGIAEDVKAKVKQPASGVQVGDLLARGEADLGFQQVSELLHVKGIDFLGPLPQSIQNTTVYSLGLHSTAAAPDAARALVEFLTGPEVSPMIRRSGMEP